jgi:uncharacterized membrane protein (DUF485 family)
MPERERPLLAELREQIGAVVADLAEMLALRWKLARLEFRAAARSVRRLAVALAIAGVMMLTALPLLIAWLAEALAGRLGIGRGGWLGIFGLALAAGGLAVALLAWWSFRRRFRAMAETLEECREDLVWLREWLGEDE